MIDLAAPAELRALVARFGGELDAALDLGCVIRTIGASDRQGAHDLAPVLHDRGAARLIAQAPVLLVAAKIAARVPGGRRWVHPQAEAVLAELLAIEAPAPFVDAPIHPEASVAGASILPGARIGRDVIIGEGSVVEPAAVIWPGTRIGAGVTIGTGAVIGRAGFGYTNDRGAPRKIPHRAGVVVDDGVELGALCTVDAGILAPTTIGRATKLDAQVHVGHGVVIGARVRIAAQVGLAGSVVVEDEVWIGGQAGIADHCRIGRGARVAAKAGVIGDVGEGAVVAGYPAVARARWLRGHARLYRGS